MCTSKEEKKKYPWVEDETSNFRTVFANWSYRKSQQEAIQLRKLQSAIPRKKEICHQCSVETNWLQAVIWTQRFSRIKLIELKAIIKFQNDSPKSILCKTQEIIALSNRKALPEIIYPILGVTLMQTDQTQYKVEKDIQEILSKICFCTDS